MSRSNLVPLVMMRLVQGPVTFKVFEPRDDVGFPSNIADVFRCSKDQIGDLLAAVEVLDEDHHFSVKKVPVRPAVSATHGKQYPREFNVTISPA